MVRALLVCVGLCWLSWATSARAESVLLACSDECPPALFDALELELRGFGAVLIARPAPTGFTPAARTAEAQRLTQLLEAGATLWIEHEDPLRVRVYARQSGQLSEAPLPLLPAQIEPRIFAAVAGSVVLEALRAKAPAPEAPPPAAPPPPSQAAAPIVSPSAGPTQLITPQERQRWRPLRPPSPWRRRFFVRAGVALGMVGLGHHAHADRPPPRELVEEIAVTRSSDLAAGRKFLRQNGYNCSLEVMSVGDNATLVARNCKVAVKGSGLVFAPALDLAAGVNVTPRFALTFTARVDPSVGLGALAHALLGLQLEGQLTRPARTGFWSSLAAGLGLGQIQARAASKATGTPYAQSGLVSVRAGAPLGYRFLPNLGLSLAPVVHFLFPNRLWALDTQLAVEVRI